VSDRYFCHDFTSVSRIRLYKTSLSGIVNCVYHLL